MKRTWQQCTVDSNDRTYLDAASGEGLGMFWAYSGLRVEQCLKQCSLCLQPDCIDPQYHKMYSDNVWYLDLGTTTRYADVKGRTRSSKALGGVVYKNVICFQGQVAVAHLGTIEGSNEEYFLVFDRFHIHRVLCEMITGRNSLRVETTKRSFRCRWNDKPSTGGSPLFHRWLLLDADIASKYIVEHQNDIPLDCREINLKLSESLADNNNHTHRLARAFRGQPEEGFKTILKKMKMEREAYDDVIRSLPPLPDCVFSKKCIHKETMSDYLGPKCTEASKLKKIRRCKEYSALERYFAQVDTKNPQMKGSGKSFFECLDMFLQCPESMKTSEEWCV